MFVRMPFTIYKNFSPITNKGGLVHPFSTQGGLVRLGATCPIIRPV